MPLKRLWALAVPWIVGLALALAFTARADAAPDLQVVPRLDLITVCSETWPNDSVLIDLCRENLFLARDRYELRLISAGSSSEEAAILKGCHDKAELFDRGYGAVDWAQVEDCYLTRSNPKSKEFARDWKGVPWNAARYICARKWSGVPSVFDQCFGNLLNEAFERQTQTDTGQLKRTRWNIARLCLPMREDSLQWVLCEGSRISGVPKSGCTDFYSDLDRARERMEESSAQRAKEKARHPKERATCERFAREFPERHLYFPALEACYLGRVSKIIPDPDDVLLRWLDMAAVSVCGVQNPRHFDECLTRHMRAGRALCQMLSSPRSTEEAEQELLKTLYVCDGIVRMAARLNYRSSYEMPAFEYCVAERMRIAEGAK